MQSFFYFNFNPNFFYKKVIFILFVYRNMHKKKSYYHQWLILLKNKKTLILHKTIVLIEFHTQLFQNPKGPNCNFPWFLPSKYQHINTYSLNPKRVRANLQFSPESQSSSQIKTPMNRHVPSSLPSLRKSPNPTVINPPQPLYNQPLPPTLLSHY